MEKDALIVDPVRFEHSIQMQINFGAYKLISWKGDSMNLQEFVSDIRKWDIYNEELLKQSFNNEDNHYLIRYLSSSLLQHPVHPEPPLYKIILEKYIHNIQMRIDSLKGLKDIIKLLKIEEKTCLKIKNTISETAKINNEIFIVHGHNIAIKEGVARLLSDLGLKPIVLHEQPSGGRTIIEKLEKSGDGPRYVIVMLTGDDEGRKFGNGDLKPRARENVLIELGYFTGLLGRDRIVVLKSDVVEVPSDFQGVVYLSIDEGDWKYKIANELKLAGYEVDLNKIKN